MYLLLIDVLKESNWIIYFVFINIPTEAVCNFILRRDECFNVCLMCIFRLAKTPE